MHMLGHDDVTNDIKTTAAACPFESVCKETSSALRPQIGLPLIAAKCDEMEMAFFLETL
jgi:hypothetical protein